MSENVKDIKELQKTIIDQNKVIAEFEAQQKANDAFKEEIEKQKTEKDSLIQQLNENKKALDSLKSIFEAQQKEKMQKAIDSLVKAGTKPEALEGKSWDYIQGRVDQLGDDSKNPSTSVQIKELGADGKPNPNSITLHNVNDFIWDGKDWVLKQGVKP